MARTFASGQRISYAGAPITAAPCTMAAWINCSSFATSPGIMAVENSAGTAILGMFISGGNIWAQTTASGTSITPATATTLAVNTWGHAACVFPSTTSRWPVLNGVIGDTSQVASSAPTGLTVSYIGSMNDGGFTDFPGMIAFAGIWNIALSQNALTALAKGISPLKISPQNLVSYCRVAGNASPEPDIKNFTWALTGTPTKAANPRIYAP
jgi:hypothetical protein